METPDEIIRNYTTADAETRVDIVCRYFPQIDGIITCGINNICYIICESREQSRQYDSTELGVRVQTSGGLSNPTARDGEFEVNVEKAVRTCNFAGGVLDDVDDSDLIIMEANALRDMKRVQKLILGQLSAMEPEDRALFQRYLNHETSMTNLADELGINYMSAAKRMNRLRKTIKVDVVAVIRFTSKNRGRKEAV